MNLETRDWMDTKGSKESNRAWRQTFCWSGQVFYSIFGPTTCVGQVAVQKIDITRRLMTEKELLHDYGHYCGFRTVADLALTIPIKARILTTRMFFGGRLLATCHFEIG